MSVAPKPVKQVYLSYLSQVWELVMVLGAIEVGEASSWPDQEYLIMAMRAFPFQPNLSYPNSRQ